MDVDAFGKSAHSTSLKGRKMRQFAATQVVPRIIFSLSVGFRNDFNACINAQSSTVEISLAIYDDFVYIRWLTIGSSSQTARS